MGAPNSSVSALPVRDRRVYANRTLNLRAIRAVGCDMDYTLIHYHVHLWEERAYEHARQRLLAKGFPLDGARFDPDFVTRGLILDLELGNIVKASRFGYVTQANHGTRRLEHAEHRKIYSRVLVDLAEPRWVFLNTLFSLSEASLYAQLVDLLDAGRIEAVMGYRELYGVVRENLGEAHMEGTLKREIVADPDRYVVDDPELPLALLDLKHAGKQLLLITNSEWTYTREMMAFAFDKHLPKGLVWRDLFDLVIVEARKPSFFTSENPVFEVVDEAGLLRPNPGGLRANGIYLGGDARRVEAHLGLPGEQILYVGDHLFADVHVTKDVLRWRTALVVRELESELSDLEAFAKRQAELDAYMEDKQGLDQQQAQLRLQLQRKEKGYGPQVKASVQELRRELAGVRKRAEELDSMIAELAMQAAEITNRRWGPLMRAGNDKSRMARQIERYADVYTSRVANLLAHTPFAYVRAPRGSLPHDP